MAITDSKLKSMLGKEHTRSPIKLSDRDGLYVYHRKTGVLSFVYRYRYNGKPRDLALGKYPNLSLLEARSKVRKYNEILAKGTDPKLHKDLEKRKSIDVVTVKGALEYWLVNYAEKRRKNYHKHRSQFERHVYPLIGHLPLELCETRHWVEVFDAITNGTYHRAAPKASGYILQNAKQALKFCRVRHFAVSHALDDLNVVDVGEKQYKRDRVLEWEELHDVWKWTSNEKNPPYYRHLFYLLILFGCRTQEIRLSTVDEWDLESLIWTVPKHKSKTGNAIQRPIPEQIAGYIKLLINSGSNDYLLGDVKRPEAVSSFGGKLWKKLNHEHSWTLHDIRRTFTTMLNDLGVEPYIVEQMLGHALGGTMGIYNRSQHLEKKRRALNLWFSKLLEMEVQDNVVNISIPAVGE
ncbi:TPA: site-specific integrase [Vibrio parahaemolyticus]|uniref:tyrosine-type recombinase/integrase n=1 Tax=Vibrio alginolyticus TaxID=663 RepID=UPI001BD1EFA1|nr:site-specific integrase [Vibrio alginolyticus]MBE5122664.1 site-specific integrase [Vibrio parahaemolyticus]ELA6601865.1 site-specific integrase [Vibrio alginolyticus]MBS9811593.1 site-specific integrase [Vibrio alginolyticus]HCE2285345.1 site-specific integrase [Vibrio parahaemolyticus]HCH1701668.1 site-specific integrase [Vibrio parahaemolyticus]